MTPMVEGAMLTALIDAAIVVTNDPVPPWLRVLFETEAFCKTPPDKENEL